MKKEINTIQIQLALSIGFRPSSSHKALYDISLWGLLRICSCS